MNFSIGLINNETPAHKHKNYEIIVYVKGNGILYAEEKKFKVHPGKIVIVPPGTVHHSMNLSDEFERIYINGEFNNLFFLRSLTVVQDNSLNEGLLLTKMIYANRYSEHEYFMALINAFVHYLVQNIKIENVIFLATKQVIENISNNFCDCNINLNTILKESGYSEDYIRAQFKKVTGKTPTEFLTQIRINHACYLIDTCKNLFSLNDIAEKCGYTDYVYFSRRFKHIMGVSPQNYMKDN